MKFIKIGIAILIMLSCAARAEIYQWKDEKGLTHYSDTIPKTAKTKDGIHQRNDSNLPGITKIEPQEFREPITEIYTRDITINNTDADWENCAAQKRQAVNLEKAHEVHRSEEINEWLWKNCRSYSDQLREIERQMM